MDTSNLVFTELHQFDFLEQEGYYIGEREKILLCAGNSCISSPLVFITLGKIYLKQKPGQSAGNFSISKKATATTKNTYNKYSELPKISEHLPSHNNNLNVEEFGYFLALRGPVGASWVRYATGLIEGDGWFGKKELHIIFSEEDTSLAYHIKKRIGHGNVYKIKNKIIKREDFKWFKFSLALPYGA